MSDKASNAINPIWDVRRSVRNFNFTQQQEVLDLLLTIAVKLTDANTMQVMHGRVINRVVDKLNEICDELVDAIIEAEDEMQAAREAGQRYIDEKYEYNPDDTL